MRGSAPGCSAAAMTSCRSSRRSRRWRGGFPGSPGGPPGRARLLARGDRALGRGPETQAARGKKKPRRAPAGRKNRQPHLRPRPPLPDQQFLPHRSKMTVVTRFAPSPTGRLHVGNIRTALHNFLFARKNGGKFILRVDDTDRERSTAEFDEAIRDDLDWLGLVPGQIVRQSERFDLYEREFERLKAAGRAYACFETP